MNQLRRASVFFIGYLVLIALFSFGTTEASAASISSPPLESESQSESINELYEKAKKEGGQLTLYICLLYTSPSPRDS